MNHVIHPMLKERYGKDRLKDPPKHGANCPEYGKHSIHYKKPKK